MTKYLKLNVDHEKDLMFINDLKNEKTINDFCNIAIEFIMKGANKRIIKSAAKNLKAKEEQVSKSIQALSFLFSECAKSKLTSKEFKLTIRDLPLSNNVKKLLSSLYKSNRIQIRSLFIKSDNSFGVAQYKDLSWRLDIEIGKRNVKKFIDPKFIMKLDTEIGGKNESKLIEMQYGDLKYITTQLENALNETSNVHVRRIKKYVKL